MHTHTQRQIFLFSIAEGSAKAEGELTQTDIQSPGRIVRESIQLLSWDRTSDNKSYPIWFRKNRATPSHPAIVIHFFTIPI